MVPDTTEWYPQSHHRHVPSYGLHFVSLNLYMTFSCNKTCDRRACHTEIAFYSRQEESKYTACSSRHTFDNECIQSAFHLRKCSRSVPAKRRCWIPPLNVFESLLLVARLSSPSGLAIQSHPCTHKKRSNSIMCIYFI